MTLVLGCGCSRSVLACRQVGGLQTQRAAWRTKFVLLLVMVFTVSSSTLVLGQSAEDKNALQLDGLDAPAGQAGEARRQLATGYESLTTLATIPYGDLQLFDSGCLSQTSEFVGCVIPKGNVTIACGNTFKPVYTLKFAVRLQLPVGSPVLNDKLVRLYAGDAFESLNLAGSTIGPAPSYAKGIWTPGTSDPRSKGVACGTFIWSFCGQPISQLGVASLFNNTYPEMVVGILGPLAGSSEFCIRGNGTVIATKLPSPPPSPPSLAPPPPPPSSAHKKRKFVIGTTVAAALVALMVA